MTNNKIAKHEDVLKFTDLIPGILSILWRLPTIIKSMKTTMNMKPEDRVSIGRILEHNAIKYKNRNAILFEDEKYTHGEFNDAINRYANYFASSGLERGNVAVVFLDNRPELLMIIGAMAKLGTIASLINTNQRGKVLLHSMTLDPGKILIIGEELLDAFEEIKPQLNLSEKDKVYFVPDSGEMPVPDGYLDLSELIKDSPVTNPHTTNEIMAQDRFANVFTSGTTGLPKASIQTHRRWLSCYNLFGGINLNLNSNDVMYVSIPFFHTNALIVSWPPAARGGAALAIRRKFSVSNFWKDIHKFNASAFIYIGEICRYLINQPPGPDDRKNRVNKIVGNGLRPDIWKPFKKRFGISKVFELYGAADGTTGFTNTFNLDCTVGWCPSAYAIARYDVDMDEPIKDENGFMQKVDVGDSGLMIFEISDTVPFAGYTNKEDNEKKIFRDVFQKGDVWYNSGDLLRDIGFKHAQFVDRLGDTFRWKGENVSTNEVEEVVNSIPLVSSSTVYGAAIPGTDGRAGMAAIISNTEPDKFDFKEVANSLRKDLPSYAVPIFLRFLTKFETTETHKIKKSNLKSEGIDPDKIKDHLFVLLPESAEYVPLTGDIYNEIVKGKYRF